MKGKGKMPQQKMPQKEPLSFTEMLKIIGAVLLIFFSALLVICTYVFLAPYGKIIAIVFGGIVLLILLVGLGYLIWFLHTWVQAYRIEKLVIVHDEKLTDMRGKRPVPLHHTQAIAPPVQQKLIAPPKVMGTAWEADGNALSKQVRDTEEYDGNSLESQLKRENGVPMALEADGNILPVAPVFASVVDRLVPGRLCFGVRRREVDSFLIRDEPIFGEMKFLQSASITGKPGRGKSTLIRFLIAQMMLMKAQIEVFDPHAEMIELQHIFPYQYNKNEMMRRVPFILRELEEREKRFQANGGKCFDRLLLFVVDELTAISLWEDEKKEEYRAQKGVKKPFYSVVKCILKIVTEGRKFNMFALVCSQGLPADVLPTKARDQLGSHFVFYSSELHAKMAGLNKSAIQDMLPQLAYAESGVCILDMARSTGPEIVAIPDTTVDDLKQLAQRLGYLPGAIVDAQQVPRISFDQQETMELQKVFQANQQAFLSHFSQMGVPMAPQADGNGFQSVKSGWEQPQKPMGTPSLVEKVDGNSLSSGSHGVPMFLGVPKKDTNCGMGTPKNSGFQNGNTYDTDGNSPTSGSHAPVPMGTAPQAMGTPFDENEEEFEFFLGVGDIPLSFVQAVEDAAYKKGITRRTIMAELPDGYRNKEKYFPWVKAILDQRGLLVEYVKKADEKSA